MKENSLASKAVKNTVNLSCASNGWKMFVSWQGSKGYGLFTFLILHLGFLPCWLLPHVWSTGHVPVPGITGGAIVHTKFAVWLDTRPLILSDCSGNWTPDLSGEGSMLYHWAILAVHFRKCIACSSSFFNSFVAINTEIQMVVWWWGWLPFN